MPALPFDDDSDSWWGGAQACFARVALATALAASTLTAQIAGDVRQDPEEIPAGSLANFSTPDEDYWQNRVLPAPPAIGQPLPYGFDQPDLSCFWVLKNDQSGSGIGGTVSAAAFANPLTNGSIIVVCVMAQDTLVHSPSDTAGNTYLDCGAGVVPFKSGTYGIEIFFARNTSTISSNVVQIGNPQGSLCCIEASEWYSWRSFSGSRGPDGFNYVSNGNTGTGGGENISCSLNSWQQGYDLKIGLAAVVTGQLLPNAPTDSPLSSPLAQFLPEFYQVNAGGTIITLRWSDSANNDSYAAIAVSFALALNQFDEVFWQNPVAPVPPATFPGLPSSLYQPRPYLPDLSDDPAGSLHGQPDEDFWANPVAPVPPALYQQLPYLPDPTDVPAGSLHGQPDEDFWANPVSPVPLVLYQRLPYLPELSDDPAGSLHGQPDEDFWQNPVSPVPPGIYQRLPCLPELSDDPAGSLYGQPDEDFWTNAVAPVPPAVYQGLPYLPDPTDDPAGSLYSQPDEDFWTDAVAPIPPAVYQGLPYLPDPTDDPAGSLYGQPDEDFWGLGAGCWGLGKPPLLGPNPRSLVPSPQALYLPDPTDDPAGSLYGQPDEDFWANPVAPVPPAMWQPLPYLTICGFDDFSCFWWSSRWGVCTHSTARGRISRSSARARVSRGVSRQSSI